LKSTEPNGVVIRMNLITKQTAMYVYIAYIHIAIYITAMYVYIAYIHIAYIQPRVLQCEVVTSIRNSQ